MSEIRTTRLESVKDIRDASKVKRTPTAPERVDGAEHPPSVGVRRYRPTFRPPMAMVCTLDDGRDDGHWVRVHDESFVIGRTEGNLSVPHEVGMSGRHMELRRIVEDGRFAWYLNDLGSTNGTFARIDDAILHHMQEFLIGTHRFRFVAAAESPAVLAAQSEQPPARNTTQQWQIRPASGALQQVSAVVELLSDGEEKRTSLDAAEHWIGSDIVKCSVVIENDPFVDACHAKLFKDDGGRWKLQNHKSLNGTWVRIDEVRIEKSGMFQAGEQRFFVTVP